MIKIQKFALAGLLKELDNKKIFSYLGLTNIQKNQNKIDSINAQIEGFKKEILQEVKADIKAV